MPVLPTLLYATAISSYNYEFICEYIGLPLHYTACLLHSINYHHTYYKMLHSHILSPPPRVEDAIDDIALTPYNCPESAFNFQGWQEAAQRGLPSLLPRSPPSVAAAPSTASSPEAVIHSVPLQFQSQHCNGKAPVRSQGPTSINAEFQGLRAQLQQLQQEKEAALAQVQKLQNQQVVNTGLLQCTTADMQNTANTSAVH